MQPHVRLNITLHLRTVFFSNCISYVSCYNYHNYENLKIEVYYETKTNDCRSEWRRTAIMRL